MKFCNCPIFVLLLSYYYDNNYPQINYLLIPKKYDSEIPKVRIIFLSFKKIFPTKKESHKNKNLFSRNFLDKKIFFKI